MSFSPSLVRRYVQSRVYAPYGRETWAGEICGDRVPVVLFAPARWMRTNHAIAPRHMIAMAALGRRYARP